MPLHPCFSSLSARPPWARCPSGRPSPSARAGVSRLAQKPSRRDLDASRRDLLETDARYQLNSGGKFDERQDYLRINNTLLTPGEVAERVIEYFALPRFTGANPA